MYEIKNSKAEYDKNQQYKKVSYNKYRNDLDKKMNKELEEIKGVNSITKCFENYFRENRHGEIRKLFDSGSSD